MTAVALTETSLRNVKRVLTRAISDARSAHLTEALASACGFRTHASLLAAVDQQNADDPDIVLLNDHAFLERLVSLDPSLSDLTSDPIFFDWLNYPDDAGILRTLAPRGEELPYTSMRAKAWRNAMIAALNTGIDRRHFTVRPGDNRWEGAGDPRPEGVTYRFEINGVPGIAHVNDAGFDELLVHVALWPSAEAERWIEVSNAEFLAGDLFASGWMERRDGAWLQFNGAPVLSCRRARLAEVASWTVWPLGYAESGPFKM